jgi:heat shock protein HslJ
MVDAVGDWQLTRGTVDGIDIPLVAESPVTMTVEGSRVSGRAACNQYGGEMVVADGEVSFGALMQTEMACEEPLMSIESAFLGAMSRVRAAALDGDALTLRGPGVELAFERLEPPPTADIVGTDWLLDTIITGDAVSTIMGDPATLRLEADGTVTGSTGCRTFQGRYTEANAEILFTDFAMDQTECPADLSSQDDHVVTVLGDGFRAAVDGQRLTLTSTGGLGLSYVVASQG